MYHAFLQLPTEYPATKDKAEEAETTDDEDEAADVTEDEAADDEDGATDVTKDEATDDETNNYKAYNDNHVATQHVATVAKDEADHNSKANNIKAQDEAIAAENKSNYHNANDKVQDEAIATENKSNYKKVKKDQVEATAAGHEVNNKDNNKIRMMLLLLRTRRTTRQTTRLPRTKQNPESQISKKEQFKAAGGATFQTAWQY